MVDRVSFEMQRYQVEESLDGTFFIQDGYTDIVVKTGLTAEDDPHDICDRMNAKAAILAMREPTEAMKSASITQTETVINGRTGTLTLGPFTIPYQAMIDAALK